MTGLILSNPGSKAKEKSIDCKDILDRHHLTYREIGHYYRVGEARPIFGWIFHLSIIRSQLIQFLEIIIPILLQKKVSYFEIVRGKETAKFMLDGNLGYALIGKLICVYPKDQLEAIYLAKTIIEIGVHFRGPAVPTDLQLNNILYTCYSPIRLLEFDAQLENQSHQNNLEEENEFTIPFSFPKNVHWPFAEIKSPIDKPLKKLLNNLYKPIKVIKPDAKGRVIKCLYFKNILSIKSCIIKEGKYNMWSDALGRDIQDRILWQSELYNRLGNKIPMPRVFDKFKENDDLYLAMEFIKGSSLEERINSIHLGNGWVNIINKNKLLLIQYLIRILDVVDKLHMLGIVHRDITPTNFILTQKNELFLIDMELAYSLNDNKPSPAFKLGTFGYMSSEQYLGQEPSFKEDIFGLGGLMAFLFTGLPPVKFDTNNVEVLKEQLHFFCPCQEITHAIANCLNTIPQKRPNIAEIREVVNNCQLDLKKASKNDKAKSITSPPTPEQLRNLINKAIAGLTDAEVFTKQHLWPSLSIQKDKFIGNEQVELNLSPSLYSGMTGILLILAQAKKLNYDIEDSIEGYYASWEFLQDSFLKSPSPDFTPSLYDGAAGIGIALQEGITSGLLKNNKENIEYLKNCFSNISETLEMCSGIAGQGSALIASSHILDSNFVNILLEKYTDIILNNQYTDGSWNVIRASGKRNEKIIGLSHGVAGIINFLLSHYSLFPSNHIKESIQKALNWLITNANKKHGNYYWPLTNKSKSINYLSYSIGVPGIAALFIKAYDILKEPLYKKVSEGALQLLPNFPVNADYSQAFGLAGIGEVYLEAYRIFQSPEWKQKTDFILNLFESTTLTNSNTSCYWSMNSTPNKLTSLMTGNCGIIHFLMRYQNPQFLGFPFG